MGELTRIVSSQGQDKTGGPRPKYCSSGGAIYSGGYKPGAKESRVKVWGVTSANLWAATELWGKPPSLQCAFCGWKAEDAHWWPMEVWFERAQKAPLEPQPHKEGKAQTVKKTPGRQERI